MGLTRLILKGIGVHGIEGKSMSRSQGSYGLSILGYIPGYVQGNGTTGAIQPVQ
jgi:hypothetical protein